MSFPIDFGALVSGEGGLTATGSTQATALPLTRQVSVFASVPAGAGTILPSSYAAGTRLTVVNRDASNTLSIYPASGDEIESLGINSAFTLSPGGDATFISFAPPLAAAPRQWFQVNTLSAAPTITGGTINGATIGLTTAAAGAFTSLTANSATGNAQINSVVSTAQNPFTFTAALNATPTGNPSSVVGLYGEADGNASTNYWELLGVVGVSYLQALGTGWASVQAAQFLPIMATGSSAQYKYGIQIALVSQDQINASIENTALLIEATTNWTGVGWTTGISFGGRQGWWPMDATATLIGANPPTAGGRAYDAAYGMDFSAVTFSTAFLKSTGFLVDGSGNTTIGSSAANYLTIAGATTGNGPTITAAGSDTNVALSLVPKGTSPVIAPVLQLGTFFTATGNNVLSVGQYPVNYTTTVDPMAKFFMTPGGTVTSSQSFYNQFSITDGVNASGDIYGLYVGHNLASANVHGGRAAFAAQLTISTAPADTNKFYVGSIASFQASAIATGSSGFGRSVASVLQTGATGYGGVFGDEIDVSIQTGASASYKHGLQIVLTADDKAAASVQNAALVINAQDLWTGHGFDVGISFGSGLGWWAFPTTATLIGTYSPLAGGPAYAAATGIDFSAVTFSTAFLKSTGFTVDGSGNETVLTTTTHTYTVATLPAAGTKGRRAFVSDATATTFGATVAGGGTNNVPVFDNGTSWVIG